ncbi:FAD-binding oxidoreductase [Agrobacterium tumefaciens]|uniref:NAD(P)/FAD-dependent oxidoreductase n=1 Tax=Agrobacterium tumefaciens TaxID=358 RepID=UPI0015737E7E|nr:FAD-dependent oxidoreductase [Agrobacterium tumefaciens]NTA50701.1 FAD-binding oxidoreductase [Agrobacterium tumefaciens]
MTGQAIETIVIGGGLHGLSAALHLARAGRRVELLERSWVGRHASGATAAGVRTLNRPIVELPISLEAMEMWHRIESIVGDHCGFHAYGQLSVAETAADVSLIEARLAAAKEAGFTHEEIVDRDELFRLVPPVSRHCMAALVARRDGAADPHRTLMAFRRSAEAAGVQIREGVGVTAIEQRTPGWRVRTNAGDFEAPTIINAAGAWADKIAAMVGDDILLGYKASMMMVTERVAPLLKPVVGCAGRPLSFKQSDQGTLVIGGGLQGSADIEAQKSFVNFTELAKGARTAVDLFPCVDSVRIVRTWAGMEATTKDHLPIIGASPNAPGVFYAFGFSGHGFQLVPIVGAILSDLIVRGQSGHALEAFAAARLMQKKHAA